jgi:hypothetical protein
MIQDSATSTRRLQLETTCDVGRQDDDARFLRIAVRRCVRNAAGQRSPRNQFERYVFDSLQGPPPEGSSGRLTAGVSQLADDICRRIRHRLPFRPGAARNPA